MFMPRSFAKLLLSKALFCICCACPAYAGQNEAGNMQLAFSGVAGSERSMAIEDTLARTEASMRAGLPAAGGLRELESRFLYMGPNGAEAQDGKVGVFDSSVEYRHEVLAFGKLPVEFCLQQRYIGLDNTTAVPLPGHLTGVSLGLQATLPFFAVDKTYLRLGLSPSFFGDGWECHSSGFRIPSRIFAIHKPDDKWIYIAGIAIFPDYDDKLLPILGFIYRPNQKLVFNIIPQRPNITYELNEKLSVFGEFDASGGEFEVNKDRYKNAVLEYKEMHMGAGFEYRFNKNMKGSFSSGGVFNRRLKYLDEPGKVKLENGAYCELRLNIEM